MSEQTPSETQAEIQAPEPGTLDWQLAELAKLPHNWAVQSTRQVRGEFTSGDYVEWQIRRIFGAHRWSFVLTKPPELVTITENEAYAQALGRMTATFANGETITQDAVGVWPLKATNARNGGTLENTAAERYETVLKAACTDALKAAAERIGSCFRPVTDLLVVDAIKRESFERKHPDNKTPEQSAALLSGRDPEPAPTKKSSQGNGQANGNGKDPILHLLAQEPTATVYWTIANHMKSRGKLDHAKAVGITESVKSGDSVDWSAALAELREVYNGA